MTIKNSDQKVNINELIAYYSGPLNLDTQNSLKTHIEKQLEGQGIDCKSVVVVHEKGSAAVSEYVKIRTLGIEAFSYETHPTVAEMVFANILNLNKTLKAKEIIIGFTDADDTFRIDPNGTAREATIQFQMVVNEADSTAAAALQAVEDSVGLCHRPRTKVGTNPENKPN